MPKAPPAALVAIGLLGALAAGGARASGGEAVTFPGGGMTLRGVLFRPQGPGPHPGVVALHGCGGLADSRGRLQARHADWGERLAAAGFLVLFPDSFGSRGLGEQCRTRDRAVRPSIERVADAGAARAFLQARPDVKPGAVSLLGWSNGGSTVLQAVRPSKAAGRPDFARAVAFYPGCRVMQEGGGWRTRLPLLVLMGEADDWTPAPPCRALVAAARARGESAEIVLYPGAVHGFDAPASPVRTRRGLAFTGDGSGQAQVGTDPAARADALVRVPAFLAR
ncbi:dienelactone hydrolase family protein [Salinarimonas soli]|uniref:Dienelactone hydrolase family protein n=1 Tax=Salinarimonas soli TaxID=1638099 RepID=A0A5B2VBY5_9HYPH|nr:dienelactone hydrolase family protein [Salinarimonas soli]KAA2236256.1 dienelactone hydrolase family protein [Salinarimonas soli]